MNSPTYVYNTSVHWNGQRRGTLSSFGLPDLAISTPPEFKGEAGVWTPEHLFVAAAEICLMATFIGIAELSKVPVTAYRSEARGRLERVEGKGLSFTEIFISPVIELEDLQHRISAERVMEKAEKTCLIANSMLTSIRVEPRFTVKLGAEALALPSV
jgi:organic hydroperoxide reductase OsmC/OhrA